MFAKVWDWAGNFRQGNKNIGVEWTQKPIHLRQLLENVKFWIDQKTYPPDEIAARFHHRLVQIHLFPMAMVAMPGSLPITCLKNNLIKNPLPGDQQI